MFIHNAPAFQFLQSNLTHFYFWKKVRLNRLMREGENVIREGLRRPLGCGGARWTHEMSFNPDSPTTSLLPILSSHLVYLGFSFTFLLLILLIIFRVVLCDMKFNAYGLTQVKDKCKKQTMNKCNIGLVKSVSSNNAEHSFKLVGILYWSYSWLIIHGSLIKFLCRTVTKLM